MTRQRATHLPPNTLRVVTYNIHKGRDRRRVEIIDDIIGALRELEPDLLFCQEVFCGRTADGSQSDRIARSLDVAHAFGGNAFYSQGCHGNATFSRIGLVRHENVDVTRSLFEKRGILKTLVGPDNDPFMVMNTHFSLTAGQRRKQWGSLVAHLWSHLETPLIACGDFNDWRGSIDRRAHRLGLLRNALWRLPMPQRRTFPAHRPRFALDRIYLRGFRVRDVRVLHGAPWDRLSDHLPVVAEIERQW